MYILKCEIYEKMLTISFPTIFLTFNFLYIKNTLNCNRALKLCNRSSDLVARHLTSLLTHTLATSRPNRVTCLWPTKSVKKMYENMFESAGMKAGDAK